MDFKGFPKMARLSRDIIVTEKIDGTNAQVYITPEGEILAGSRTRWITPEDDNFGFARWVRDNKEELLQLGPGQHFGEWWGRGIQRGYGIEERRFSLFNVSRWVLHGDIPQTLPTLDPRVTRMQEVLPPCCDLVPILYQGPFYMEEIEQRLDWLQRFGSYAAPKFMNPEGVVVFHIAANVGFKKTIDKDEMPKGLIK
jgi:hypothetical protein